MRSLTRATNRAIKSSIKTSVRWLLFEYKGLEIERRERCKEVGRLLLVTEPA